ncbi:unnamed protein product [Urochloa humidicola]
MMMPTTVSTCTLEMEQGKHVFEIFGYSKQRGMGNLEFISSGTFSVGGHDWSVLFFQDGYSSNNRDDISACLRHLSKDAKVQASWEIRLVDQTTGLPTFSQKGDMAWCQPLSCFPGSGLVNNRRVFEASVYLRDDHLTIECIVTVKKPRVSVRLISTGPVQRLGQTLSRALIGDAQPMEG